MSVNRPSSQCNSGDKSNAKIFKKGLIDIYLNETACQNSSGIPCWIPQIKNLVPVHEQKRLQPCLSWPQYDCMVRRFTGKEIIDLITSLQKDCKYKTIHFSNKKAHSLDDYPGLEVTLIRSV